MLTNNQSEIQSFRRFRTDANEETESMVYVPAHWFRVTLLIIQIIH